MGKKKVKANRPDPFPWAKARQIEHSADCARIRQVLENLGFVVTLADCHKLWAKYSQTQEGTVEHVTPKGEGEAVACEWWPLPLTYKALESKLVHNVLPEMTGVAIQ